MGNDMIQRLEEAAAVAAQEVVQAATRVGLSSQALALAVERVRAAEKAYAEATCRWTDAQEQVTSAYRYQQILADNLPVWKSCEDDPLFTQWVCGRDGTRVILTRATSNNLELVYIDSASLSLQAEILKRFP